MEINSILGAGSNPYSYSSINDAKLTKALEQASTSRTKIEYLKNNPITPAPSVSGGEGSQKFIKEYTSSMAKLMTSANEIRSVNSSSIWNKVTPVSSNANVVSPSSTTSVKGQGKYEINVAQLASGQVNASTAIKSDEAATSDMNLNFVTSNVNVNFTVRSANSDGTAKTNSQVLSEMAKQINSDKNLGLTAAVVEKDGTSSLKITGKTGESNAFLVTGASASSSGLTSSVQSANDAKYTVSKNGQTAVASSSSSNNIDIDYGKVNATLKSTGSAEISMGIDSKKLVSSVENLVKNYNSTIKLLNDNFDRGTGVGNQLKHMVRGPASEKSMNLVGITVKKDGTLAVDSEKLVKTLNENPAMVKDVIGSSFGVAQGIFQNATSGLSKSGTSLINNDLKALKQQNLDKPTSFSGLYNKKGSFSSMNYATIGMFLNTLG